MHITIFGANGKVGRILVESALAKGYSVHAFCHSNAPFAAHPHLTIQAGDIHDSDAVATALQSADAVMITLGSWGTPTKDIVTSAVKNILPAMERYRIRRIISLTGVDARAAGDSLGIIHRLSHFAANLFASKILNDGEKHIKLLEDSQLDWTVLRSPVMLRRGDLGMYRLTNARPLPWQTIHRQSVASAMLEVLEDPTTYQNAPFVARSTRRGK
jgi:putative NADH-flavin reductase